MKTIVIRWKVLAAAFIGAIVLSVCGLSGYKVLWQRSRWTQSTQNLVTNCGNATGSCRSNNYDNSTSPGWFNEVIFPSNKPTTKSPEKRLKKGTNYRDSLNKQMKLNLLGVAETKRHTKHGSSKRIISKNSWSSWRQALFSDALHSINFEDKNTSEETDLNAMASVTKDVFKKSPNVSRTKATSKTKKGRNGRRKRTPKRDVIVVATPTQISKKDFMDKPNRPHPPEIEKTGHFTSIDLQYDANISFFLWVFLGSAALSGLWAVVLDSIRSYIKSLCRQNKARKSSKDPEHRQIVVNSDCNLAHLPLDLQEILIKKLDVRCKRNRFYGWKKVGEAFEIPIDDLRYLKLEYKRDTGSPTSKLLEILGITKKKTISDLVTVLEGPELRRTDISSIITLT